jgi:hypothetical protein
MSNIDRLLDEAEKAQRKGHLLLAEVCRDAADQLGLVIEERNQLGESYDRAMLALDKVVARLDEVEALRIGLEAERDHMCMLWWAAMNHPGVTVECAGLEAADRFNALAAEMDRIPLHTQGDRS